MKRFYNQAAAAPVEGGWQVQLDGRGIKTARGAPQVVPTEALAELLAQEWAAQGEEIDRTGFPLRDLADYAIDVAGPQRDSLLPELLRYAETDTLCYRADPDEPLFARQQEVWEPLVAALEAREGIRMQRVSGIVHRPQPPQTLARLRERLEGFDPFTLAATQMMASLASSLGIALAALEDPAEPAALWDAANLEEDWQVELWGEDWEAAERRAARLAAFTTAFEFARAARA